MFRNECDSQPVRRRQGRAKPTKREHALPQREKYQNGPLPRQGALQGELSWRPAVRHKEEDTWLASNPGTLPRPSRRCARAQLTESFRDRELEARARPRAAHRRRRVRLRRHDGAARRGGREVRYVAFSIATRSLPEGFPPDTLAREVREATAELGIPAARLTVHDFDVRTFPDRRQDILEILIALWEECRPDVVFLPSCTTSTRTTRRSRRGTARVQADDDPRLRDPLEQLRLQLQAYFALEQRHVERKVAALARYASQQHRR